MACLTILFLGKKTFSNFSHWFLRKWHTRLNFNKNFRDIGYPRVGITMFYLKMVFLTTLFIGKKFFEIPTDGF